MCRSLLHPITAAGLVAGASCLATGVATAQAAADSAAAASCQTPHHRQFDFWLGRWDVRAPDGRLAGTNVIESALDGCVLVEWWTGAGPSRGTSLNFYNATAGEWQQTWIDNRGQPLFLRGGLRDGRMVLEGSAPDEQGRSARQRITWTPLEGGDVRQLWEASTDEGVTWRTIFDGRYSRRLGR